MPAGAAAEKYKHYLEALDERLMAESDKVVYRHAIF